MHGRRGLVSLFALDAAFFGRMDTPWTLAADRLVHRGWLTEQDAEQMSLLWWFGVMIGNTDMHYGNISLFLGLDPGFLRFFVLGLLQDDRKK